MEAPDVKTIGIFPASGALGGSTYRHLLETARIPPECLILVNRFPEKVPVEYVQKGVRVRQATYESTAEELEKAFAGIEVLFLVSYPSHVHEYRVKVQLPAIDAARRAGVSHIFYSSLGFAGDLGTTSIAVVMQAHLASERRLAALSASNPSFTYTSIRESLYSESFPIYTSFFNLSQPVPEILIPHDGSGPGVSWVKRDELGEATANLIASYASDPAGFPYVNGTVLLTGPREWSLGETVDVLGQVAGREVKIREVPVDEYVKLPGVLAVFGSEEKARTWATAWEGIRAGETAVVTPLLEGILGRLPEGFDVTVRRLLSER